MLIRCYMPALPKSGLRKLEALMQRRLRDVAADAEARRGDPFAGWLSDVLMRERRRRLSEHGRTPIDVDPVDCPALRWSDAELADALQTSEMLAALQWWDFETGHFLNELHRTVAAVAAHRLRKRRTA